MAGKWKLKTNGFKAVHLYNSGQDKVLCGRPQENYDTEEGFYTVDSFGSFGRAACKSCLKIASSFDRLTALPTEGEEKDK